MSIHQNNIVDTFHYCINLEDDDIVHVSMFIMYIFDSHFSIYSPANSQSPLSFFREQEKNRRKIPEKDHISPRYIFDRTTTTRGKEGEGWSFDEVLVWHPGYTHGGQY